MKLPFGEISTCAKVPRTLLDLFLPSGEYISTLSLVEIKTDDPSWRLRCAQLNWPLLSYLKHSTLLALKLPTLKKTQLQHHTTHGVRARASTLLLKNNEFKVIYSI